MSLQVAAESPAGIECEASVGQGGQNSRQANALPISAWWSRLIFFQNLQSTARNSPCVEWRDCSFLVFLSDTEDALANRVHRAALTSPLESVSADLLSLPDRVRKSTVLRLRDTRKAAHD